jgi:type IV pilus assembly protein PilX
MNRPFHGPVRQRGAVLFTSLMILILLTLLGVAAMQVTTMQERMSGNYRVDNLSFQNAERRSLQVENRVRDLSLQGLTDLIGLLPPPTGIATIAVQFISCDPLDTGVWESARATGEQHVQNMGRSCGFTSLRTDLGVDDFVPFRITALEFDSPTTQTAQSILQSVYIPVPPVAIVAPPPPPPAP